MYQTGCPLHYTPIQIVFESLLFIYTVVNVCALLRYSISTFLYLVGCVLIFFVLCVCLASALSCTLISG